MTPYQLFISGVFLILSNDSCSVITVLCLTKSVFLSFISTAKFKKKTNNLTSIYNSTSCLLSIFFSPFLIQLIFFQTMNCNSGIKLAVHAYRGLVFQRDSKGCKQLNFRYKRERQTPHFTLSSGLAESSEVATLSFAKWKLYLTELQAREQRLGLVLLL